VRSPAAVGALSYRAVTNLYGWPATRRAKVLTALSAALGVLVATVAVAVPGAAAAMEPQGEEPNCPFEVADGDDAAAGDEDTAALLAATCDVPVEDVSARRYDSRSWVEPDGQVRSEVYAVPQWTRDAAGEWVDVDTTLELAGDGTVRARAVVGQAQLSAGGEGPMVSFVDPDGHGLSLTWPLTLPQPVLTGNVATYPGVFTDVDLRVSVDVNGFSYLLVVHTPQAAADPALARIEVTLAGDGVAISQNDDGHVLAVNDVDEVVFAIEAAYMWDSPSPVDDPVGLLPEGESSATSTGGSSAEEASPGRVEQIPVELVGDALAVIPDADMLADEDLTYPIFIDPTAYGKNRSHWATVHQQQASSGWTNDSAWPRAGGIRMGLCNFSNCHDATGVWRGVMRFDTSDLRNRHIISAVVKMTQTHTAGCGSYSVRLWEVGTITNGISWNGVTWISHGSNGYLRSVSVPSSHSCGTGQNQPIAFDGSNVRTRVQANANASSGWSSISFGVRSSSETNSDHWRRVSSSSLRLEVSHAPKPATPTGLQTNDQSCATSAPGPWLTTGRPKMTGTVRAVAGTGSVRYQMRIRVIGQSSNLYTYTHGTNVGVNTTRNHTVPSASTLPDGAYRWRMRTTSPFSGNDPSTYASWCYFRVDTTPPPEPSAVMLTQDPQLGELVQFQLSGSSDTHRFRHSLNGGPTTTQTASGGQLTIGVTPPTSSIDHVLQVWALDEAGNVSVRHDLWFTVSKSLLVPAVGVWRLDGDWRDDTATGNDVVDIGPGVSFTADRQGRSDSAVQFSAQADGCLKTAGPVLDTSNSFTVAAWMRLSTGGGTNPAIVTQAGEVRPAFYLEWHRGDNRWNFSMPSADASSVTWRSAKSASVPKVGQWQHVAGVYDAAAGRQRMYVDGQLETVIEAHPSTWNATGPLIIGCAGRSNGDTWHVGNSRIDEVVAYQGVLTEEQISALMESGPSAGVVSWWPLRATGEDGGPAEADLVLPSSPLWVPDAFGRPDSALRLSGASCAEATGAGVYTDGSFAVAAWVNPADAGDTHVAMVSQAGVDTAVFQLVRSDSNQWGLVLAGTDSSSASQWSVYAPSAATAGGWQHVMGVYDQPAAAIRIYVDGVLQGTAAAPAVLWRATGGVFVGCAASSSGSWGYVDGAVHDVRLWRGVATAGQAHANAVEPLSYWELHEDVGGFDAWGGNHLSFVGDHEWVDDRFGECFAAYGLGLDGTGYAQTSGAVVTTDESFTVTAWARLDDKGDHRVVLSQAAGIRQSFYLKYVPTRDRWRFELMADDAPSTTWLVATSIDPPQTGVWYHLAGVYNLAAGTMTLYVDGVPQETVAGPSSPWHTPGELLVGVGGNIGGGRWDPMVGAIDQVRVYSGVLDGLRIGDQAAARPLFPVPPDDCDWFS
jgi:hypothetical protein